MKTLFLLNNRWHVWECDRRAGSNQPKLDSIVCIDRNAKGITLCLILLATILTGCTRTPPTQPPPMRSSLPPVVTIADTDHEEALPALVFTERLAASERDLATLAQLWAHDARIIDSRGTDNPADDYRWEGRAAILDRYELAVFPAPPPPFAEPPPLVMTRTGDTVVATIANDRWRFIFAEGRWWLQELAY